MKILAQGGELANRKGIYPPLPGVEKSNTCRWKVLEAKAFAEKEKQRGRSSYANISSTE